MLFLIVFSLILHLTSAFLRSQPLSYNVEREKLRAQEEYLSLGGQLILTPDERKVDNYLKKNKKLEVSKLFLIECP